MESFNGPPVKPPSPGDRKKADGSFAKRNNWLIIVIIAVILFGAGAWFLVSRVTKLKQRYSTNLRVDSSVNDDDDTLKVDTAGVKIATGKDVVFTQPYADVKVAKLDISGGAAAYLLKDTTGQLFYADAKTMLTHYEFDSHKDEAVYVMDFHSKKTSEKWDRDKSTDTVNFKLNVKPEWEINVEAGAVDLDFDLSKYKLRSLKLSGGAGQFVMKVGQPLNSTNITVSTGASDVTIAVPKNAACQIQSDTGLSSSTFDNFIKKNGHYETSGFDKAKNKIYIQLTGGISDFKVQQY